MIYLIIQVILMAIAVTFAVLCVGQLAKLLDLILRRLDALEAKLDALATDKTQREEKRGESSQSPVSGNTPQSPQG